MNNPISTLIAWIEEERQRGAPDPQHAILSTTTSNAAPHGRVVSIREIDEAGFIFFTKKGSRKEQEITENPLISLTFWFELYEREVMIDGQAQALSTKQNQIYWQTKTPDSQIKFCSYSQSGSNRIENRDQLEENRTNLKEEYGTKPLPMPERYCGFKIIPFRMVFYTHKEDAFSDVSEFILIDRTWRKSWLSP
ncbi:pyridoxamine 5'-phosphate oxidase [Legionella geestiana]|uniref:Pyridoxamine 5'-phosphate oxidase n=1 Tax=Legionella geestiana TaxID=45065 RepID=A0A0W0U8X0_9GAMM|nr:pyridoxal 5'-phosphate synthase [Legionella geestiana]KTD04452.1 pyridoxamine 5'-phosphate oxidase [Legionella geestiana]STX54604.1 pyridoxamine 5'-phosphate oxidase [Legionella geestiana]